jgi:phospholipid/cholesterol/gamma-HCH transport system substrate-binding protein
MKGTSLERIVGLFVLTAIACMSYFALKLGSVDLRPTETYTIEARFSNASGLIVGSQVSVAGVAIGSVTEMKLAKDFSAIVAMRIRKEFAIPSDSIASIRGHGLLGDKYVSISPGSEEDTIKPGARITDTESAVDLESLLSRFAFGTMQGDKSEKKEPSKAP